MDCGLLLTVRICYEWHLTYGNAAPPVIRMRALAIPLIAGSLAPLVLYIAAMAVQKWHAYQRLDGVTVDFGLDRICFEGGCHDCTLRIDRYH